MTTTAIDESSARASEEETTGAATATADGQPDLGRLDDTDGAPASRMALAATPGALDAARAAALHAFARLPLAVRDSAVPALIELAAQQLVFGADADFEAAGSRRAQTQVMPTQAGGLAVLPLRGAITPRGSFFSILFGGSGGLQGFRSALAEALADDNVSAILIDLDSPGGLIDLVPETAAQIREARGQGKRIVAQVNTLCASAAYWIASAADEIVVTPSGHVGSIGVYTIHEDVSKLEQMMGIKTTIISAGDFKVDGNPYEPLSKSALQGLQQQVDDLYAMFVGDVAAGRGVSVQAVTAGYGRGRCVLAAEALALKMVDRMETFEQTVARLGGVAEDPPADADDLDDDDDDDDDDLAPEAGANDAPEHRAQDTSGAQMPPDYLNGEALREQPAWSL